MGCRFHVIDFDRYHARQPRWLPPFDRMLPPPVIERRQSNAALLTKLPPPKPAGFPFVQHPPHLGRPFRLFTHAAIFGFLWLTFKMDSSDAYKTVIDTRRAIVERIASARAANSLIS